MPKQIEDYIKEHLTGEARKTAFNFVSFLREHHIAFYKDNGGCWKDKIYYWLKYKDNCVAFIAVNDPDEPENCWTVWSDDCKAYAADMAEQDMKKTAWKYVNFCSSCGSCGGGKQKTVFGKDFDGVCVCTFRVDNPDASDLNFLKRMIEIRIKEG